jgi:hypothetical protein
MSRWYRAYEGTVTDAKLGEAALIAECSRSVAIAGWHCLLESAASRNNCGSFDATPRRIAVILCEPVAVIDALIAAFEELGLIANGAVASWQRRQFQSDDSKDRVAKHRAKKRLGTVTNDVGNDAVTACNGDVTPPKTETDTYKKSSNEDSSAEPTAQPLTKHEVIEAWRQRMVPLGFPDIRKMTAQRERMLRSRLKDSTLDEWQRAMDALERSAFCRGENDRGWRADFDFLLQPKSFTKLLEGAYDH